MASVRKNLLTRMTTSSKLIPLSVLGKWSSCKAAACRLLVGTVLVVGLWLWALRLSLAWLTGWL